MSFTENPSSKDTGHIFPPSEKDTILDPGFYITSDEDKQFLKEYIGFKDDAELREHAFKIRRDAYEVVPYPCIEIFEFIRFRMRRVPEYPRILALPLKKKDAIFLEMGAGMGQELRRLVCDGYPAKNIVATDLHPELWNYGHELFKDNTEAFPVSFVQGDIFKLTDGITFADKTDANHTKTLLSFKDRVSTIHAGLFFHMFNLDQQKELARRCVSLLVREKGSIIFGEQLGTLEPRHLRKNALYAHSPESWESVWREVFDGTTIKYRGELVPLTKSFDRTAASKIQIRRMKWNIAENLFWSIEII